MNPLLIAVALDEKGEIGSSRFVTYHQKNHVVFLVVH